MVLSVLSCVLSVPRLGQADEEEKQRKEEHERERVQREAEEGCAPLQMLPCSCESGGYTCKANRKTTADPHYTPEPPICTKATLCLGQGIVSGGLPA